MKYPDHQLEYSSFDFYSIMMLAFLNLILMTAICMTYGGIYRIQQEHRRKIYLQEPFVDYNINRISEFSQEATSIKELVEAIRTKRILGNPKRLWQDAISHLRQTHRGDDIINPYTFGTPYYKTYNCDVGICVIQLEIDSKTEIITHANVHAFSF